MRAWAVVAVVAFGARAWAGCGGPSEDFTPQIHVAPAAAARSLWIRSRNIADGPDARPGRTRGGSPVPAPGTALASEADPASHDAAPSEVEGGTTAFEDALDEGVGDEDPEASGRVGTKE